MSKTERLECLDSWLFQLKLSTKAERNKALENASKESYEYYKALINRNKKQSVPSKRILTFKY